MKKALLLCLILMAATFGFAQQQLATLNHNDSITVYYGASALQQAHAAAVNGDIITLSPGTFDGEEITKAVTIRGAGMFPDTASRISNTVILDNLTININNDSLYHLTMEGIYFSGEYIRYSTIYNPQFIKCYFRTIEYTGNRTMLNSTFINCIINYFTNELFNNNICARNTIFVNSVILDNYHLYLGGTTLINCIARVNLSIANNFSIQNSIVYDSYSNIVSSVNGYSSFNSIGINTHNNYYIYYNTTGLANHYLYNYGNFASVFKNFRGTYDEGITFELLDTVAATILGNDGTQVGIYGGTMPFDPRVSGLNIRRLNVGQRTTADGKLPVDIEVVSDEATNNEDNE